MMLACDRREKTRLLRTCERATERRTIASGPSRRFDLPSYRISPRVRFGQA